MLWSIFYRNVMCTGRIVIFLSLVLQPYSLVFAFTKTHTIQDQQISENESALHPYILRSKNTVQNLLKAAAPHVKKMNATFADLVIKYTFAAYEDTSDLAVNNLKIELQHKCMDQLIGRLIENPNIKQTITPKISITLDLDRNIIEEQSNRPFSISSSQIQDYQIIDVITEITVNQCDVLCEENSGEFGGQLFKRVSCQAYPSANINWNSSYSPQLPK